MTRFVWTQGFTEMRKGASHEVRMTAAMAAYLLHYRFRGVSWIVAKPDAEVDGALVDEGRTMELRCSERFWAIRDDHPADCTCGCGGQPIVTMLLPEEY